MEVRTSEWTDGRLDDLNAKVDKGFERVDVELRALRLELGGMQRTMVHGFIAMTGGILAGFAVLGGLIATQL